MVDTFTDGLSYVFDVVTDGDDAIDLAWDLTSGQADVDADYDLVWDDDLVKDEDGNFVPMGSEC